MTSNTDHPMSSNLITESDDEDTIVVAIPGTGRKIPSANSHSHGEGATSLDSCYAESGRARPSSSKCHHVTQLGPSFEQQESNKSSQSDLQTQRYKRRYRPVRTYIRTPMRKDRWALKAIMRMHTDITADNLDLRKKITELETKQAGQAEELNTWVRTQTDEVVGTLQAHHVEAKQAMNELCREISRSRLAAEGENMMRRKERATIIQAIEEALEKMLSRELIWQNLRVHRALQAEVRSIGRDIDDAQYARERKKISKPKTKLSPTVLMHCQEQFQSQSTSTPKQPLGSYSEGLETRHKRSDPNSRTTSDGQHKLPSRSTNGPHHVNVMSIATLIRSEGTNAQ